MSSQGPQRPRRTSPSCATKPQPMRATLPFTLRQGGSPTRSNSSISNGKRGSPIPSPTQPWEPHRVKSRRSPDHRTSPERSPSSPCFKVEKPKPMRATPPPSIRRTSSLDTIATYLGGHWPRESYQPNQKHQSTQTEDTLEKKGSHKRSSSWGSAELKEKLKQQRRKGSRNSPSSNSRASPVPASHSAGHSSSSQSQSRSIAIPVPRSQGVRIRGSSSVEGLNQEIEKLVLNGVEDDIKPQVPTPDGHRAPFPGIRGKKMCDSDTQTHSNYSNEESSDGSRSASRSHSESPPFQLDGSQPSSRASSSGPVEQKNEKGDSSPDLNSGNKYASSPGVNKSYLLTREPPEGCEKVLKTFSDPIHPMFEGDDNNGLCPDKTKVYFCPKGMGLSAFCPLPNLPGEFTTKTLVQNNNIAVDDQK